MYMTEFRAYEVDKIIEIFIARMHSQKHISRTQKVPQAIKKSDT